MDAADTLVAECASSPHYAEGIARDARASIRLARADIAGAAEDRGFIVEQARRIKDPQRLLPALASSALACLVLGSESEARALAAEALALARINVDMAAAANHLIFIAGTLGIREALREIVELAPEGPWKDLTLAGAHGDLRRAADLYATFGAPSFEALARLFAGESLIEEGRRAEGEAEVARALAFFRLVGAQFFVRRGEGLLAGAYSDSA